MRNFVVMSLYNRVDLTKKTIEHLMDFSGEKFHLWIVNDGSSDSTKDYLETLESRNFCESVTIKNYDDSQGKAKRLNEFFDHHSYDFCSVVDNDVLLPLDWLAKSIRILSDKEEVGMVGVNVEGLNGGVKMQGIPGVTEYYNTACIGGACLTFGKTFKESIKRLCEDYGRYGHEDAHMTFEMRSLGKLVVCLSDFGIHLGDNSFHKKVDSWGEEYVQWKLDRFNESKSKLLDNYSKFRNVN